MAEATPQTPDITDAELDELDERVAALLGGDAYDRKIATLISRAVMTVRRLRALTGAASSGPDFREIKDQL